MEANHFSSFEELYKFMRSKPVEPREYKEPEETPKKKTRKKDVLQADRRSE